MDKLILIVDDEQMVLEVQQRNLEEHGYRCFTAKNAAAALRILANQPIDLVLVDIRLPGRSGLELLKELKADYPDLAIIMATGTDDYQVALQCLALGADDYLIKPFNALRVLISVRNALGKQALSLANQAYQQELEKTLFEKTEKIKASQTLLIQQEKLAAIGQLAAGVAHEINNPLGFITSNLSTLRKYAERLTEYLACVDEIIPALPKALQEKLKANNRRFKLDALLEDLPELVADSLEGTDRIKKIVQGLKCFSRTDSETPAPVDINECLESAITIVWNEIKYNAKLERELGDLPPVHGYMQQLAQVFMNLLVNASHAITGQGVIRINSRLAGERVEISITDNGCGIPEANLVKIFDPFFTTKEPGKGTGLGMSIVREIIDKHGGTIAVTSGIGHGTEFVISLPALTDAPK
jgi:signal transduction histidine kinase